jgi:hypothetical protein
LLVTSHSEEPRGRSAATVAALVLGLVGLAVSLVGVTIGVLPRQFTQGQQRSIMAWEVSARWRTDKAGAIFPAQVAYAPPAVLADGTPLTLTAHRIGIATQTRCAAGADPVISTVLTRYGCEAMLRATYADTTDSYVLTVGVAVLPGTAQAAAAEQQLSPPRLTDARAARAVGVRTVPFGGTVAAAFQDSRRQLLGSLQAGPYIVMYAIGYAGYRPQVEVASDQYSDAEMTSMATGVARAVATVLGAPAVIPRCPGAPGC